MSLKSNLEQIRNEVGEKVTILAVTKKQPDSKLDELKAVHHKHCGENFVQELLRKKKVYPEFIWHLIGPLQSNKVKQVIGVADLIHTVDRVKIAREIDRRAEDAGVTQKVLIQVNISNEESKSGFSLDEFKEQFSELMGLENVLLCGLMIMPPFQENPEESRVHFKKAKLLLEKIRNDFPEVCDTFTELSMGTSQDYKVAAEEGATIIRVGTVLLGERESL